MLIIPKGTQTEDSAAVLWEKIDNASIYRIYVNGKEYAQTSKTDCTLAGLAADSTYDVYVTAGNIKSETVSIKTKPAGRVLDVTSFGALGNGTTVNTSAIQAAIDECKSGDTVYIPNGVFMSGAIYLRSNMTLKVDGKLLGSPNPDDYPIMQYRWEGREHMCYASLVNTVIAGHLENITISGGGTIDANGEKLFEREMAEKKGMRGRAVCIRNTDTVYLKDITVRQSPAWCLHTIYCKNVALNNVKIHTKYNENGNVYRNIFNGDGFDPDSCDTVYVFNSQINSQDDCIAIKSGRDEEGRRVGIPSENIRITNCRFGSGFGVAVGSETSGDVRNVLVQDCVFENTYSVASVKSPRGRGSIIENIRYESCTHTNNSDEFHDCEWFRGAIYVDEFYSYKEFDANAAEPFCDGTPVIRNVSFKNIRTSTIAGNAVYLTGLSESPLENIALENIDAVGKFGLKANNIIGLKMKNVNVKSKEDEDYTYTNVTQTSN